ncbi:DUF1289 domain-containing protein [Algiphilus sp.]|uniref:DUF1289 domain-containing protein n=1 Tax=Algiphilus sp. TaxID=1872431 RepID=UPI003B522F60
MTKTSSGVSPRLADPPSPCIGVCALDGPEGLCVGCLRTGNEIAEWPTATPERRRAILAETERRNPRQTAPKSRGDSANG